MKENKKLRKAGLWLLYGLLCVPIILTAIMLLFLIGVSFMDSREVQLLWEEGISAFHILPVDFSLDSWSEVLLETPTYLLHFWNSVWLSFPTTIISVFVSALTGYGLAFTSFRGKNLCVVVLVVMMLLPYQVTLMPNFLVFDTLGMIGSRLTVILPGIFHPLGMVAMLYFMRSIPQDIMEAARLDGAGELRLFFRIALPQVRGGILLLTLYNFVDSWNLVEPVLVLIRQIVKYPLAIAIQEMDTIQPGVWAACCVLLAIPVIFAFTACRDVLVDGLMPPKKE